MRISTSLLALCCHSGTSHGRRRSAPKVNRIRGVIGQQSARTTEIRPALHALWGAKGTVGPLWDVLATWRDESTAPVTGKALDCGHFLQEERPQDVINELLEFFG